MIDFIRGWGREMKILGTKSIQRTQTTAELQYNKITELVM